MIDNSNLNTQEYKKMIEESINEMLRDVGMNQEQFFQICEKHKDDEICVAILNIILASEDFLTFKDMMI